MVLVQELILLLAVYVERRKTRKAIVHLKYWSDAALSPIVPISTVVVVLR